MQKKTVITIQSIRTDECFQLFWDKVLKMTEGKGINDPVLPRKRKHPKRYEDCEAANEYETPFLMYRRIYYEALDWLTTSISTRFDQPGYRLSCIWLFTKFVIGSSEQKRIMLLV